jgi:hypothetical protein
MLAVGKEFSLLQEMNGESEKITDSSNNSVSVKQKCP